MDAAAQKQLMAEAEAKLRAALEREPGNARVLNDLACRLLKRGKYEQAKPLFKKAVEIVPVEHMDEVLARALALESEDFLRDGIYDIEDIYEVPGGAAVPPADVPHPTGIN